MRTVQRSTSPLVGEDTKSRPWLRSILDFVGEDDVPTLPVTKQGLQRIRMAFYPRLEHLCHPLSVPPSDTLPAVAASGTGAGFGERTEVLGIGVREKVPLRRPMLLLRACNRTEGRKAVAERVCGQKPPNGAPEGVIYFTLSRQLPAPRPSFIAAKPRRVSRAWPKAVAASSLFSPAGRSAERMRGDEGVFSAISAPAVPLIRRSACPRACRRQDPGAHHPSRKGECVGAIRARS
jgi:hypothetical protein